MQKVYLQRTAMHRHCPSSLRSGLQASSCFNFKPGGATWEEINKDWQKDGLPVLFRVSCTARVPVGRLPRIHGSCNALHISALKCTSSTFPQASLSQRKLQGLSILAHEDMCAQPPILPQSLPPPPPHFGQLRGPKQSRRATCPALTQREESMRLSGSYNWRVLACVILVVLEFTGRDTFCLSTYHRSLHRC